MSIDTPINADTPVPTRRPLTPRQRAERTLGHAAFPEALDRVFAIWPEAHVHIQHTQPDGEDENGHPTWSQHRQTVIEIRPHLNDKRVQIFGEVRCHESEDQYDRIEGNKLAFADAVMKLNEWQAARERDQRRSVQSPMDRVGEIDGQPVYRTGEHHVVKNALVIWDPVAHEHRAVEIAATNAF